MSQDKPSVRCQHEEIAERCADCALLEVRDILRELRPALRVALANPLVRRWLGLR